MKNSNPDDTKKYASMRLWKKRWYRITSFLAAVVVFCTTYALILPAVTQERTVTQDSGVSVSSINIDEITDGEGPFDKDSEAGNDTDEKNGIVRTFDTVKYKFTVSTDGTPYDNARVKMEFILPLTKNEAEFDVAAMGWMDTTAGYTYNYQENQTRTIGDKEYTNCQVLTCYKHLQKTVAGTAAIPGSFTETFTVKVKAMKNGDTIQPTITASLELNLAQCVKKTADPVKVSAAPRYNVKLDGGSSYKDTFDFTTGNDKAQNKNAGNNVVGRAMKFGVTLQLYNNGNNKGFKGIELPTGHITFDLKLKSEYGSGGNNQDVTKDYTPLLWSCDYNSWTDKGATNSDGRKLTKDFSGSAYEYAPWSSAPESWYGDYKTCYHGGGWSAIQTVDTISVTVSHYGIDVNKMPTKNGDEAKEIYNLANGEGCFSSGEIWIVQPFNKKNSTPESGYDIQTQKGDGMFYTTVEVQNVQAKSIGSGDTPVESTAAQMNSSDDKIDLNLELYSQGSLQNRIAYRNDITSDKGVGVDDPYNGKDFATPGTEFYILSGLDYTDNGETDNQLYWATNFTRINADIFEVTGAPIVTGVDAENYKVLYVAKGENENWLGSTLDEIEKDLQENSTGSWLQYSDSLEKITRENRKCIGVLYCVKGPLTGDISFSAHLPVKIREGLTADQIGKAYMTVSTSRVWTKENYTNAKITFDDVPDLKTYSVDSNENGHLYDFPTEHYKSANTEKGSTWYVKEKYNEDGSASTPHYSSWNWFGDTLLVIKFKSQINKTLLQKLPDGSKKTTFNLDANQRYVDFMLQPETVLDNQLSPNFGTETTVTIVDTLPKYLNYVADSAHIGGTYTQTFENGGTQGTVTGGTQIISADENAAPSNVGDATLFKQENSDGTTTLTWKVKCKIGEHIKPIYYSVEIGNRYDANNDIPVDTTQLPYNVRIYAAGEDLREPTAANGNYAVGSITAVRGNAYSFGKFTKNETVEPDGVIDYTVYYDNISTAEVNVKLMDVMPANGINGSQFSGSYTVQSFKFDITKCNVANLQLYYTEDISYKNATTVDESYIRNNGNIWKKATISSTDGTVTDMVDKPVAWAVLGTLESRKSVNINLRIKLNGASKPNLTYVDFESASVRNFYNNTENNNGATVDTLDEAHGYSIKFTKVNGDWEANPNAIAVSNIDGTGRFKVEKGKKYKVSLDYRFVNYGNALQVLAIVGGADINAMSLREARSYTSDESQRGYKYSTTAGKWANGTLQGVDASTLYFVAPKNGNVFILPIDMSSNEEIWFDNIKIEEIQDNKYINTVISGSGANSTTQQTQAPPTPIIRRSIEGLTWLDRDSDGVQNDGSNRYISGVKVSLLKLMDGFDPTYEANYEPYCYPGTAEQVTVETGKQVSVISQGSPTDYTDYIPGRYRFMDLPEGIYAVKFEDGSGKTKISPLIASPANRGEDDTLDSDGIAVYKEDRSELLRTYILNINMPAAAKMESSYIYESKNNDSGFYKRGYELPKSGGKGTDTYTFLGLTIWGFALLAFVYRKARKTFGKSK